MYLFFLPCRRVTPGDLLVPLDDTASGTLIALFGELALHEEIDRWSLSTVFGELSPLVNTLELLVKLESLSEFVLGEGGE